MLTISSIFEHFELLQPKDLTNCNLNVFRRRTRIQKLTEKRLEQAEQRKEILKEEKKVSKMMKNYDFFEKCMELGEKNYYKNIELLEEHNQIRDKGMRVIIIFTIFLYIDF